MSNVEQMNVTEPEAKTSSSSPLDACPPARVRVANEFGLTNEALLVAITAKAAECDPNHDGFIEQSELHTVVCEVARHRFARQPLGEAELASMTANVLRDLDSDADGKLTVSEFASFVLELCIIEASHVLDQVPADVLRAAGEAGMGRDALTNAVNQQFFRCDGNHNGCLDASELKGLVARAASHRLPPSERTDEKLSAMTQAVLADLDVNSDGKVTKTEFARFLVALYVQEAALILDLVPASDLREAQRLGLSRESLSMAVNLHYAKVDVDRSGMIEKRELRSVVRSVTSLTCAQGGHLDDKTLDAVTDQVLRDLDKDGDGALSKPEFAAMVVKLHIRLAQKGHSEPPPEPPTGKSREMRVLSSEEPTPPAVDVEMKEQA